MNFSIYKLRVFFALLLLIIILFSSTILLGEEINTSVIVEPTNQTVEPEVNFIVDINCIPGQPIKAYELTVLFNSSVLKAIDVSEGDIFNGFTTFFNSGIINNTIGEISQIYGLIVGTGNVSSPGTLIHITFIAEKITATSIVDLINVGITNETNYISVSIDNGSVQVDATAPSVVDNSPVQGYTGDSFVFNISATDNIDDSANLTVMVDWSHGNNAGNISMEYMGATYFSKTVTLDQTSVDDLTFEYYCLDSYGNSVSTPLIFIPVNDNDPPTINSVSTTPSTQEIGGYVNISTEVIDNIEIEEVNLNITYPDSTNENISITQNNSEDIYFCNKTFSIIGTYSFYIWAGDTSDFYSISNINNFYIRDINYPEIFNINILTSNPVDTDNSFGWVNLSCEVVDNIEVDTVKLNVTTPDDIYNNISMVVLENSIYYYNSSIDFTDSGNYSYYIWANDTSNNVVISDIFIFSIPPNWDINEDGDCSVLDLILISNVYGDSNTAGWIREDVDNNGAIEVIDLVYVSNHHGETWWE
jgi:hypothetical protein